MNLFDYLEWRGDVGFDISPVTTEDLAIFAQLVYCPFEDVMNEDYCGKTLGELQSLVYRSGKPRNDWSWQKSLFQLWTNISEYKRFADVRLENFVSNFVPNIDKQFSAATFGIGDVAVVAFRGTDLSIVGWRENFEMAYHAPVPSHMDAVAYLNAVSGKYKKLYVCGHSKGGNLALYAAAFAKNKDRIESIVNFDGPALDKKTYLSQWKSIKDKVETYIPQNSIVGMTMGYGGNFAVVKSGETGMLAHDQFTWEIEHRHFKTSELSETSRFIYRVMHDFMEESTPEEIEILVRTIFKVLDELKAEDVDSLKEALENNLLGTINLLRNLDQDEKAILDRLIERIKNEGAESVKLLISKNSFKLMEWLKNL